MYPDCSLASRPTDDFGDEKKGREKKRRGGVGGSETAKRERNMPFVISSLFADIRIASAAIRRNQALSEITPLYRRPPFSSHLIIEFMEHLLTLIIIPV